MKDVLERMAAAVTTKEWVEVRIRTREGRTLDTLWANISLMDGEKLITGISLGIDITERKLAEKELRLSEQKFSLIYEQLPFAAALSRPEDTVLVDVNQEFERVFGISKQEAIGKTSLELGIHPDEEARARIRAKLLSTGSPVHNLELRLVSRSLGPRIFLMNIDLVDIGESRYILQTAQDITERKQAEQGLAEFALQQQELYQLADRLQKRATSFNRKPTRKSSRI